MMASALKMIVGSRMRFACSRIASLSFDRRCSMSSHAQTEKDISAQRLRDFDALFPMCLDEVLKSSNFQPLLKDAVDYFKMSCEYNVPFGKKTRGLTVIETFETVVNSGARDENWQLSAILGWCVEWLQSYLLVCDDVIDRSWTRRGRPCWFRVLDDGIGLKRSESVGLGDIAQRRYLIPPGSGVFAMNDTLFLERCVYILLDRFFANRSCYSSLVRLFNERMLQTSMGQQLDMLTAPAPASNDKTDSNRADLACFTEARYSQIVRFKTAYYSFCLPVEAALAFANSVCDAQKSNRDPRLVARARAVASLERGRSAADGLQALLLDLGELFQIQDDVLDCFGDAAATGKVGTDIADGKCSWLAVQALQRASDAQRRQIVAHFGRPEPSHVDAVRRIYRELELDRLFAEYESRAYDALLDRITQFRIQPCRDANVNFETEAAECEQLAGRLRVLLVSLLKRTFKRTR